MNKLEQYVINKNISNDKIDEINNIIKEFNIKNKDKVINYIINNDLKMNDFKNNDIKLDTFFNIINNHHLNDSISKIIGLISDKYDFSQEIGIFGKYDPILIEKAVTNINKNGYYIFDHKLNNNFCQNIINQINEFKYFSKLANKTIQGINIDNPIAPTCWIADQSNIVNIPEIQELITDPNILSICQEYLQTIPINSQTNLWYSVKFDKIKDQTQKYHQDYDDVKFIKLFIYLTDVTSKTGPHTYIQGSRINRKIPKNYRVSKRLEEDYVKKNYPNDIREFTGQKGTIIFEDTNGFHKGKSVEEGYRIILQLEFTASLLWTNEKILQTQNIKFDKIDFINKFSKIYIKYL